MCSMSYNACVQCPCAQCLYLLNVHRVSGPGSDVILNWKTSTYIGSQIEYEMDLDGNVTVCLEDFLVKVKVQRQGRRTMEETILVFALLPVSCICLLLSLVVYCLLPVLRSLPGKNNMVLIISVLCCQISLLIGYAISDSNADCTLIGIMTHYFSLCFDCALIVCSYHCYTIFTTMQLSRNLSKENRTFVRYTMFIIFTPFVLVSIVVLINIFADIVADQPLDIGYGTESFCLVGSKTIGWTGIFIPTFLTLVINMVLFCLTYSSLKENEDIETNDTDERHVHIYCKLNVLSFFTWAIYVTYLSISWKLSVLRVLFIVLQCTLGIYIFIRLILTRRVTQHLATLCCESRQYDDQRSLRSRSLSLDSSPARPRRQRSPKVVGTGFRQTSSDFVSDVRNNAAESQQMGHGKRNIHFAEDNTWI